MGLSWLGRALAGLLLLPSVACQPIESGQVNADVSTRTRAPVLPRGVGDIADSIERALAIPTSAAAVALPTHRVADLIPNQWQRTFETVRELAWRAQSYGDVQGQIRIIEDYLATERTVEFNLSMLRLDLVLANGVIGHVDESWRQLQSSLKIANDFEFEPLLVLGRYAECLAHVERARSADATASMTKGLEYHLKLRRASIQQGHDSLNFYHFYLPYFEAALSRCEGEIARIKGDFAGAEAKARIGVEWVETLVARWSKRNVIARVPGCMGATRGGCKEPTTLERLYLDADDARVALAESLQIQGKLVEAEAVLRETVRGVMNRAGAASIETATRLVPLGTLLAERGRFADGRRLARLALAIFERHKIGAQSWNVLQARLLEIETLAAQKRWDQVAPLWAALENAVAKDPISRRRFVDSNPLRVMVALESDRSNEAAELAKAAAEAAATTLGDTHPTTVEARMVWGLAMVAAGRSVEGLRLMDAALPRLLSMRGEADDESGKWGATARRHRYLIEGYLLAGARDPARSEALFTLAERVKSRATDRAVAAGAARFAAQSAELAELIRREQDSRRLARGIHAALAKMAGTSAFAAQRPELQRQLEAAERERASLRRTITEKFPRYAELIDPLPPSIGRIQETLRADEALIAIYSGQGATLVWALAKSGRPAFALVELGSSEIERRVEAVRQAIEPGGDSVAAVPPFDVAAAYDLYRQVLMPVESAWRPAKRLTVIPHGALAMLPFAMLPTAPVVGSKGDMAFAEYRSVHWLARRVAVAQTPSAASFVALRQLPPGAGDREQFVGFGDPVFSMAARYAVADGAVQAEKLAMRGVRVAQASPVAGAPSNELSASAAIDAKPVPGRIADLGALPDTRVELMQIAAALGSNPATSVLVGADANDRNVKRPENGRRKVIAFATHGLVPGDIAGLAEPALALTPAASGGSGDGLLTASDVLDLKLDSDWVVLSACNTAAAQGEGAEAISGLGRAFFYAGARALLVSNWAVETVSARQLTTSLFRSQAADPELARDQALQKAMLEMIDRGAATDAGSGRQAYAYAHPIFWAPFSLIGDGR
ncbi:MAG: CHAT domain-containing protein [Alphaproteobacteria bacterium]|nr:CHAT domain-containing protein [Alphaproteobacteria bacterium]